MLQSCAAVHEKTVILHLREKMDTQDKFDDSNRHTMVKNNKEVSSERQGVVPTEHLKQALLRCKLCSGTFSTDGVETLCRIPKVLKCSHTFCHRCIAKQSVSKGKFQKTAKIFCPICQKDIALDRSGIEGLHDNTTVIGLLGIIQQQRTAPASEDNQQEEVELTEEDDMRERRIVFRGLRRRAKEDGASGETAVVETVAEVHCPPQEPEPAAAGPQVYASGQLYPQLQNVQFEEPSCENQENHPPPYASKAEEAAAAECPRAPPPSFESLYPNLSSHLGVRPQAQAPACGIPLPGMCGPRMATPLNEGERKPSKPVVINIARPRAPMVNPGQRPTQRPMAQRNVVFMNGQSNRGSSHMSNPPSVQLQGPPPSIKITTTNITQQHPTMQIQSTPASVQCCTQTSPTLLTTPPFAMATQTPPSTAPKPILKMSHPDVGCGSQRLVTPPRSRPPPSEPEIQEADLVDDLHCQLKLVRKFGCFNDQSCQPGKFQMATRVSVTDDGDFLIVDPAFMSLQMFNSNFKLLRQLKVVGMQCACVINGDRVAVGTHRGLDIYKLDTLQRVQEFQIGPVITVTAYGSGLLALQSKCITGYMGAEELKETSQMKKRIKPGLLKTSVPFQNLTDVMVNNNREIVVLDAGPGEIYVLSEDGHTKMTISPASQPCGKLLNPQALAIDQANNFYICDTGNRRVLKFCNEGKFSRSLVNFTLGTTSTSPGVDTSLTAYGICIHKPTGRLLLTINGHKNANMRVYQL